MYISIESGACVGCETCVALCEEVFSMDVSGIAHSVGDVPEGLEKVCQKAARMCPADCIIIDDD